LLRQSTESAGEKEGAVLVRQNQGALGTQLETSFAFVVDKAGRRLPVKPFANPTFVQLCHARQLFAGHRARAIQCLIQPHPFAEIDHPRDQSTAEHV
jgi:hypothetical protein